MRFFCQLLEFCKTFNRAIWLTLNKFAPNSLRFILVNNFLWSHIRRTISIQDKNYDRVYKEGGHQDFSNHDKSLTFGWHPGIGIW